MTDNDRDFISKIFSKMNVKMYHIAFNILRDKFDAEEAVVQMFLKIIDNIERISALPCPQIEPYCVIMLKNEIMNIIRRRKKIVHVEGVEVEEITFRESQADTWKTDAMTYLIWYQDGIECHISGNLNKDEIVKIAENISK